MPEPCLAGCNNPDQILSEGREARDIRPKNLGRDSSAEATGIILWRTLTANWGWINDPESRPWRQIILQGKVTLFNDSCAKLQNVHNASPRSLKLQVVTMPLPDPHG
jgi:hypothetical protein